MSLCKFHISLVVEGDSLVVGDVDIQVGEVSLETSGTANAFWYNMFARYFQTYLKSSIEEALIEETREAITAEILLTINCLAGMFMHTP